MDGKEFDRVELAIPISHPKENSKDIIGLLADGNCIAVNKDLIWKVGLKAAILFSELESEYRNALVRGDLCEDGMFVCPIEYVEKTIGLSRYQQKQALNALEEIRLVDVCVRGFPSKRHIRVKRHQVFNEWIKPLLDLPF